MKNFSILILALAFCLFTHEADSQDKNTAKPTVHDRAIADATEAIRLQPNDAFPYYKRGESYLMKGDYDRAIADCTQALRLDSKLWQPYYLRGDSYRMKGDHDRAIADYTEAIRLEPKIWQSYCNRGESYRMKGDHDRAIADYTEAIRFNPNNGPVYAIRSWAYKMKGDHDRAIADATEAIRFNPNNGPVYAIRSWAYKMKGDHDRAIADATEAIRFNPNNGPVYAIRSWAYKMKGDHDRAIADATEAIRLDPNNPYSYSIRGEAYSMKSEHDHAIADYTEAIRLNPKDGMAYFNRSTAYRMKGDHDRAIADCTELIRLFPKYASAYSGRGKSYRLKGDHDRAIADYTEAIRLDPTQVTNAWLKELKDLKHLTVLDLRWTKVTDVGLQELKDLKHLTTLDVRFTKVTDAGVKELLKSLTTLKLREADWADIAFGPMIKAGQAASDKRHPIVDLEKVVSEFNGNELAADNKYKNKKLEVIGCVSQVARDPLTKAAYLTLQSGVLPDNRLFINPLAQEEFSKLIKGDKVTVIGICQGKTFLQVEFRDCRVLLKEPPKQERKALPKGWAWYTSKQGRFIAILPDGWKETKEETNIAIGLDKTIMHKVEGKTEKMGCCLMYSHIPDVGLKLSDEQRLDGAIDGSLRATGGTFISEKKVAIDRYAGREILFRMPRGTYVRTRCYVVDSWLVNIIVIGVEQDAITGEDADRLMKSFQPY